MSEFYKAATPVEISYIAKASKLRVGSLAFIVPFEKLRSINAVECVVIAVRSGKRGKNLLSPVNLTIKAVDFDKILQDTDFEIYNLVRDREGLGEAQDQNRLYKTTIYAKVTSAEIEDRDLLKWDVWQFIGFLVAKSMDASIVNTSNPTSLLYSTTSLNKYTLRHDAHIINREEALNIIDRSPINDMWRLLLRQVNFDKRFKSSVFTATMIEYFSSNANRLAKINDLHKYLSGISQRMKQSRAYRVENRIDYSTRYVEGCVKYYRQHLNAIEELVDTGTSNLERYSRLKDIQPRLSKMAPLKKSFQDGNMRLARGRLAPSSLRRSLIHRSSEFVDVDIEEVHMAPDPSRPENVINADEQLSNEYMIAEPPSYDFQIGIEVPSQDGGAIKKVKVLLRMVEDRIDQLEIRQISPEGELTLLEERTATDIVHDTLIRRLHQER